ncbi:HEXXH motif domain-containing protein [Rhizocola hellebori]|uniref:HEXXH motif domain-containing protein n=1 Tax=Rhizocola hellebori TaxID=1392758 RepID=A0A8J3QG65_9ACTN|nr:HEXXH motif-containing putative peptide modification protein [Rhizocola hellebori]GIH08691.1 HEXXH motif domain-containing protein [Rhizocola hellebori]
MPTLTHSLGAAHFAALASGYGDAECLALLRAGQASRRRLLLRAVAEAAPTAHDGLKLLGRVAVTAPKIAEAALRHPMLGVWASGWLRQEPGDTGYLTGLAAAAAARAQLPFRISIRTISGAVAFPGLGAAHGLAATQAVINGTSAALVVAGRETIVEVPSPFTADVPGWYALRSPAQTEAPFGVDDLDPYRDCFGWSVEPRLTNPTMGSFQAAISLAWQHIQAHYPRHAEAMQGSLTTLVPLQGVDVSAASRLAFGAIGVCVTDDPDNLALLLIHEFQHMKLGALLDMVRLHADAGPAIHWAPWRADPRPVPALLQGTYAHLGVCDYWRTRQHTAPAVHTRHARIEFAYWHAQTSRAAVTLAESGELTEAGLRFVGGVQESLAEWEGDLGEEEAGAVAEDLADSAAVTWRLANRKTDQEIVRRMAALFRAGAPCPRLPAVAVEAGCPAGAAKPTPLAILLREALTNPSVADAAPSPAIPGLPQPTSADIAYVRGDYRAASASYRDRITRDRPGRPGEGGATEHTWAGLALSLRRLGRSDSGRPAGLPALGRHTISSAADAATALIERPELVREITRETLADPVAVAGWLAPRVTAELRAKAGRSRS